jgi:predicted N-acyltransferase
MLESAPAESTPAAGPEIRVLDSLRNVPPAAWNSLADAAALANPVLRHEFLHALEDAGCVGERSGWVPQFLTLWDKRRTGNNEREGGEVLRGAMPLYVKLHSYGEYVFDWAWADAYQRAGHDYYPKLLSAIPFSPITGPRLLAATQADRRLLLAAALRASRQFSSLHVLFPSDEEAELCKAEGMLLRRGVQFHWINRGYDSFEQFLADLSSAKRKKIRQERRRAAESGVRLRRLVGGDIGDDHWRFFHRCYASTYRAHHSTPYLNLEFFRALGRTMPENVLLVVAELDGKPVAGALNLFSRSSLFGRYWGALAHIPLLHFETCYYQALEFCIERRIAVFEGGAQGEHKLARGFLPTPTCSAHWLREPAFADAVERFLAREASGIEQYLDELNERAPFRKQGQDGSGDESTPNR